MASASLAADNCSYSEKLRRTIAPGMYMLGTPSADCGGDACRRDVPPDPYVRYQAWGAGSCAPGAVVDDSSELLGINYKASKCSADAYAPGKYSATGACAPRGDSVPRSACMAPTEDTRLSNPPCTLRGTGWNRWEWLCYNPQDRAIVPFEWNTSYRIVVKDNHTPIIEQPIDQSGFQPAPTDLPSTTNHNQVSWTPPPGCGAAPPGAPNDASWRTMREVRKM